MDYLSGVSSDLFDISDRVREIDPDYYVMYNHTKKRYEVHNKKSVPSLAIVAGNTLDVRTMDKLQRTRVERREAIIKEIRQSEIAAEREEFARIKENFGSGTEEYMSKYWRGR